MRTQVKINLFVFSMLLGLGVPVVLAGYLVIDRIVYRLNEEILTKELNELYQEVADTHATLEHAGVSGIPEYIRKNQQEMLEKFKNYTLRQTGRAYVLDAEGRVLAHPVYPRGSSLHAGGARKMLTHHQGLFEYMRDGQKYLTIFQAFPEWNWWLALEISKAELFAERRHYLWLVLVISLLIFLGVFLLSHILTRHLGAKIDTTLACLREARQGNLQARIQLPDNDEIGVIQQGINRMIRDIAKAHDAMKAEIEQRKRAEAELKIARDQAEAANQAKTDFVANISHELRTPMNGILGMAEMLLDHEPVGEQREKIQVIHESGSILLQIINELLDVFKLEAGKVELEHMPFDPMKIVRDALQLMEITAREKGLYLKLEADGNIPPLVEGDKHRLRQILLNLVGNALKFTEQGGITVQLDAQPGTHGKSNLYFAVTDTGIGIPPEKRAMLFDKFNQADISTTRRYGGTGLGLFISRQLVGLMGGDIGVDSTPGQGSRFWFRVELPVAPPMSIVVDPSPRNFSRVNAANSFQGHRVLLVEDNRTNQLVAKVMLNKLGCETRIAGDGQQALDMLETDDFDLVLMDVQMPVLDGYETTRRIRYLERGGDRHVAIIAMTANAMPTDREKCLAAGMDDYLSKPIAQRALADMLNKWLRPAPAVTDIK